MTTARRRAAGRAAGPLSLRETLYLKVGPTRRTADAFPDEATAYDAWLRHREQVLERCQPGRRPWAWWSYELDRDAPSGADQPVELARLGLLDADEVRTFRNLAGSRVPFDAARGQAVLDAIAKRLEHR